MFAVSIWKSNPEKYDREVNFYKFVSKELHIIKVERTQATEKIRAALILILTIIVVGISGYMIIEGDTFINALYMTIITVSTVGFGEIHTLSMTGKIFTIVLILSSFGTYAYAISIITSYFVEGQLRYIFKGYRRKINHKKMENHVIICGFGRNGQQAANELIAHSHPFLVVENKHDLIMGNLEKPFRFIEGDATQDETLKRAYIDNARALITTLPNDADNLYVVLTARSLNPSMTLISRASNESSERKLRMAGVNNVVMPEKIGGAHMATLVANPEIVEFLEHLSIHHETPTNLEEIDCENLPEKVTHKTIFEIDVRQKTGANIIGIKKPDGTFILNPLPDTKVLTGSKLFVLGTGEQIEMMKDIIRSGGE